MGFRTVVVKTRSKLETRLNYLVVRGQEEKKVFLDEINTLIVESTAVSLTASLICELTKRNIKVIFCDEKYNPQSEIVPYYGAHNSAGRCRIQVNWNKEFKAIVWKEIIIRKIILQATLLQKYGFITQAEMLFEYARTVERGDATNREGHAAKVYFNSMLGSGNSRNDDSFINGCLNYGYAVVLSAFNREIVASGYLTQFGIWHDNEFNEFNLACDLMEVFRPFVDELAFSLADGADNFKMKMLNVLNLKTFIGEKTVTLENAIRVFAKSFFRAMEKQDEKEINFPLYVILEDEL